MKKDAPDHRQNAETELAGFIDKFTPEMAASSAPCAKLSASDCRRRMNSSMTITTSS